MARPLRISILVLSNASQHIKRKMVLRKEGFVKNTLKIITQVSLKEDFCPKSSTISHIIREIEQSNRRS